MSMEDNDGDAQPSWWGRQKKAFQEEVYSFDLEDCLSCRIIGGGSMIGAGAYVAYVGYRRAKGLGRKWGFIPSTMAASAMLTLGLMRLVGYNPFSSSGRSVGIDWLNPLDEAIAKSRTESELWKKQQEQAQQPREKPDQL